MYIQRTITMSPHAARLMVYVLLSVVTLSQGLQLFMDTTRDGGYCGHLYCWTDKSIASNNIRTIFGIAIYDVNKYSESVKIASLSVFGPDVCLRENEVTSINAKGNVSKYHAELVLAFSDTRDCFNGSYVCELEFANINDDPDVIRETVSSGNSRSCYDIVKELRKENVALKTELSRLQENINKSLDFTQGACLKGGTHNSSREIFLLWGSVPAVCDTRTDGGGWIVIQKRTKGDVYFYRGWSNYKKGFGSPDTDFWIGNDIIHNLTSHGYTELRVDFVHQGKHYFAHYSNFYVASENFLYRLSVSGFNGTAGDSLSYHDGSKFSTFDKDNDDSSGSCASTHEGGWWYKNCQYSSLNGKWGAGGSTGLVWYTVTVAGSVSVSEMKIRHK